MAIEVTKKEGENTGAFLYRFSKRVRQSGILKEAKKRRFRGRSINRGRRKKQALYRVVKKKELERERKYGR